MITISVTAGHPRLASELANAVIDEFLLINDNELTTRSHLSKDRLFFGMSSRFLL